MFRQLKPERRNPSQWRDRIFLHRPHDIPWRQIIKRRSAAASSPDRQQLILPIVKAERQNAKGAVFRREAKIMRDRNRPEPEIGMAQHNPLWPPGRTTGVEDCG